jgi:hypothetical protein
VGTVWVLDCASRPQSEALPIFGFGFPARKEVPARGGEAHRGPWRRLTPWELRPPKPRLTVAKRIPALLFQPEEL